MTEAVDRFDAVVLAGGAARRFGGVDKTLLTVGGTSLLDRVLAACVGAATTIVVGPVRPTGRHSVRWTREEPPGGGPVAAIGAALPLLGAPTTLLFAADLAFVTAATARRLLLGVASRDGAVLVDASGRDQPLAAAYRVAPLVAAVDACRAGSGGLDGVPMRALVSRLELARLPDTTGESFDCDTWQALRSARSDAREDGHRGR